MAFAVYTGSRTSPFEAGRRARIASTVASVSAPYPDPKRSWSMIARRAVAGPPGADRGLGREARHDLVEVGSRADVDAERPRRGAEPGEQPGVGAARPVGDDDRADVDRRSAPQLAAQLVGGVGVRDALR